MGEVISETMGGAGATGAASRERSRGAAIMDSGTYLGTAIGGVTVAVLIEALASWRLAFGVVGVLTIGLGLVTARWLRDDPARHPGVNAGELDRRRRPAAGDRRLRRGAGHAGLLRRAVRRRHAGDPPRRARGLTMAAARPYDGPIVDAHQHFRDPAANPHPWLAPGARIPFRYGDYDAIKRRYLPPDYARDAAGHDVRETVYVETEWDPADPIGETRYASAPAATHGRPNAIAAQAWLDRPDVAAVLERQAAFPLVRSVRHKPGGPTRPAAPAAP